MLIKKQLDTLEFSSILALVSNIKTYMLKYSYNASLRSIDASRAAPEMRPDSSASDPSRKRLEERCSTRNGAHPMIIVPRAHDPDNWLPRTIRHTSDGAQFGGIRVLVREIPPAQQLEVQGVLSQFWMGYRPTPQEPGRMIFTCQQTGRAFRAEHNPMFLAPGAHFSVEWQQAEGLVA